MTFHTTKHAGISRGNLSFYYSPQTRAGAARVLLEELGAEFDLVTLDMKAGQQRTPEYLAINPMGKVPAIVHDGALVTEQGAVFLYLADLFPEANLAPKIGDPLRGPYTRWMVYYGSSFEPALMDRSLKHEPAPPGQSPYGDFDTMMGVITSQLKKGPYILGETFSAADILWGTALKWTTGFKLVPETPEVKAYIERVTSRPSFKVAGG